MGEVEDPIKQSEQTRKRMEAISERIDSILGFPEEPKHSEPNIYDLCPVCDCPLRRRYGRVNGHQRYKCASCGKQYFGEEVE